MSTIFDLLYREYCRSRLAEMRKQLLLKSKNHPAPEVKLDESDHVAGPSHKLPEHAGPATIDVFSMRVPFGTRERVVEHAEAILLRSENMSS
jgi:hypothetical protein